MNISNKQKLTLVSHFPELKEFIEYRQNNQSNSMVDSLVVALLSKIESVKGEKGDKPIRGVDYWTDEDIKDLVKELKPVKGKDYFNKKDIEEFLKAVTPVKGVDYKDGKNYVLTDMDKREIAQKIKVPVVDKVIEKTVVEKREVIKEVPYKYPIEQVISEFKKRYPDKEIEFKDIKGVPKKLTDQRWHGGGLSTVSHDTTLTGLGTPSSPLSVVSASGSGFQLPISGVVNGSNTSFSFTLAPNAIVVDGVVLTRVTNRQGSPTTNWTGTTSIVLAIAPNDNIAGIA